MDWEAAQLKAFSKPIVPNIFFLFSLRLLRLKGIALQQANTVSGMPVGVCADVFVYMCVCLPDGRQ